MNHQRSNEICDLHVHAWNWNLWIFHVDWCLWPFLVNPGHRNDVELTCNRVHMWGNYGIWEFCHFEAFSERCRTTKPPWGVSKDQEGLHEAGSHHSVTYLVITSALEASFVQHLSLQHLRNLTKQWLTISFRKMSQKRICMVRSTLLHFYIRWALRAKIVILRFDISSRKKFELMMSIDLRFQASRINQWASVVKK